MKNVPTKLCRVQGCGRPHSARGYCLMHYKRWRKNADMYAPPQGASLKEKFEYDFAHSQGRGERCWRWRGKVGSSGYGYVYADGKHHLAHRLAYEYRVGTIPEGLFVCHGCDNPLCVNPSHLYLGTHHENIHEAAFKGRLHTKLHPAQVSLLKKVAGGEHATQREWAEAFGVNQATISRILSGDAWWHAD